MTEKFLRELKVDEIKNYLIFLDIDGTLVEEKGSLVDEATAAKVETLKGGNKIYLCSNKKKSDRNIAVSEFLRLPLLDSPYKKPDKRILDFIPEQDRKDRPFLVVGDRFLIDGLFARNLGAKFIKVKKLIPGKRGLIAKVAYLIDDAFYRLFGKP
ncbi:MAG: hypothetical protein HY443_00290 [Candidatus Nealsonbacteria bacterium]|nr:hypothetical protein [Candidatus Nealsonbacteria bacterium]